MVNSIVIKYSSAFHSVNEYANVKLLLVKLMSVICKELLRLSENHINIILS